jgi:hypothetical protein
MDFSFDQTYILEAEKFNREFLKHKNLKPRPKIMSKNNDSNFYSYKDSLAAICSNTRRGPFSRTF